jgi:peptide/nickel transport system substrate-binding protein
MTPKVRRRRTFVVLVTLLMAACASSTSSDTAQPSTTEVSEPAVNGGTVTIRVPADPGCWDPFAPCGTGPRAIIRVLTLPQTVVFAGGKIMATPLLASEPVLEKGPPQRLTYRLNPRAVWSDGTPITSSDLRYTWEQGATGPNIGNRTGWEQIAAVDDSDPRTAVITFAQPYAAWTNPFGALGFVLPKHLLDGKDRLTEMKDGVTWSGGPWKLDKWTKGQSVRFVPNPAYWGDKPHLDALVLRVIPDAGATFAAYKSGEVSLIQGVPPEVSLGEVLALPDTAVDVTVNTGVNGLLFNTQKAPLDSAPVRQALAYATDRDVLVPQAFGTLKPDIKPIHALMTPVAGRWYMEPFAKYRRDVARVDQLMRGAGWARGSDGVWAKGGQRAEIELVGTAGNKNVELQEQILLSQWKDAGFDPKVNNVATTNDALRRGNFHVGFYTDAFPSDDPSRCALMCSRNIPTEANGLSGANFARVSDAAHDAAWDLVNGEVDEAKRLEALKAAYQITSELLPILPTAPGLSVLVHNTSQLRGVRNDSGPNGPWLRTADWFCRGGTC